MHRALFMLPAFVALGCGESATSIPSQSLSSELQLSNGSDGLICALATQLRPENENPPAVGSQAKGQTVLRFGQDGMLEHDTQILNKGGETFVAGHIHIAPDNVNGPVVVPLFSGFTNAEHIRDRNQSAVDPALAEAICSNPTAYYVNYHTTMHPGGAIRGQLGPPGNN